VTGGAEPQEGGGLAGPGPTGGGLKVPRHEAPECVEETVARE